MLRVPHKEWTCVSVDNLEATDAACEMCRTHEIRYVHHMEHPDCQESLAVGCICAEENEFSAMQRNVAVAGFRYNTLGCRRCLSDDTRCRRFRPGL